MTIVKTTPKELIAKRENLINNIKKNWDRIKAFNSVENNFERPYDIKEVYKQIASDSYELVKIKVSIQAINMGLTKLADLPKGNMYELIFMLQQLKEQRIKLNMMPIKGSDVIITKAFVDAENKKLNTEIARIEDELEKRNNQIQFVL